MAEWLRKLCCLITGGHTYADSNMQCCKDEIKMVYRYRNRCCKCGKVDVCEIPMKYILPKEAIPSTYVYIEEVAENV